MKTEVKDPCLLAVNLGDTLNNACVARPKTTLGTCAQAIKWAADSVFESATGELVNRFMRNGEEGALTDWRDGLKLLILRRLAVEGFALDLSKAFPEDFQQ